MGRQGNSRGVRPDLVTAAASSLTLRTCYDQVSQCLHDQQAVVRGIHGFLHPGSPDVGGLVHARQHPPPEIPPIVEEQAAETRRRDPDVRPWPREILHRSLYMRWAGLLYDVRLHVPVCMMRAIWFNSKQPAAYQIPREVARQRDIP